MHSSFIWVIDQQSGIQLYKMYCDFMRRFAFNLILKPTITMEISDLDTLHIFTMGE